MTTTQATQPETPEALARRMGEPGRKADRARFATWSPVRQYVARKIAAAEWSAPSRPTLGAAWRSAMAQMDES